MLRLAGPSMSVRRCADSDRELGESTRRPSTGGLPALPSQRDVTRWGAPSGITFAEPRLHLREQILEPLGVFAAADQRGVGTMYDDEILDSDRRQQMSIFA